MCEIIVSDKDVTPTPTTLLLKYIVDTKSRSKLLPANKLVSRMGSIKH